MSISNSWSSFSRSLIDVLRTVAVDFISLVALDVVAGGGVEPFVVVAAGDGSIGLLDDGGGVESFVGLVELFIGDWERERSDEPAVDAITGGINLLTRGNSAVD